MGICAATADEHLRSRALELADELNLPLACADDADCDLLLAVTPDGLELREVESADGGLRVDFGESPASARRLATASRRQPLARAIGLKKRKPTVLDATAGLGRDAIVLARLGCTVTAVERSAILGAMLRDGLERAAATHSVEETTRNRITVVVGNAVELLSQMASPAALDVVYLDPMYPPRGKSALPKKDMRLLRRLVGDDPDAGELLAASLRVARNRVVVKRIPHAPPLAPGPSLSCRGKLVRYDVYLTRL